MAKSQVKITGLQLQVKASSVEEALTEFYSCQKSRPDTWAGIKFLKDCGNGTYEFSSCIPDVKKRRVPL